MKKWSIIFFCFLSILPLLAQKDTMDEYTFCSGNNIMNYLETEPIYTDIFKDPENPNENEAISVAWNAFNHAFSIEGLPHGLISEIFGPAALENINKGMGVIGNNLALIQIASDYSNDDKLSAMSNSVKSSMFYAIGKWGWKSLKIAGAGLQVFDYMLTSFGNYAVSARQDALAEAYNKYYNSGMGKRNLTQWKEIIKKLTGQDAIKKEIDSYLNLYFEADALDKKISGGWYTDEEVKAVKANYSNTYLLPYLKPLFLRLEEEARQEQIRKICDKYRKLIVKLNEKNTYHITLEAPEEKYSSCKVAIEVEKDGKKEPYVKGNFDENGKCTLSFTKYSLLIKSITKARAVLRYETPDGPKMFYQNIDLKKTKSSITFTLPKEDVIEKIKEDVKDKTKAKQEEKQKTGNIDKSIKKNESAPVSYKEKTDKKEKIPVDVSNLTKALFTTNGLPLNVKIKKTKETSDKYIGTLVHGKIPKGNVLTINKITGEMSLVYKLKGPFAPQLLCKGLPVGPNTYSGAIVTNDVNAVNVGIFTLVLLGN